MTSLGKNAGHNHELYAVIDDVETYLFRSDEEGTEVSLGTHAAGTIVRFMLRDLTSGYDYFTGNGSLNPDGIEHVMLTSTESPYAWEFGFEDVFDGGDMDFNDCMFLVENVLGTPGVVQPEVLACTESDVDAIDSNVKKVKVNYNKKHDRTRVQLHLDAEGLSELMDGDTEITIQFKQGDEVIAFTASAGLVKHGRNLMDVSSAKKAEEKKAKKAAKKKKNKGKKKGKKKRK